jgi:hypothetical protein
MSTNRRQFLVGAGLAGLGLAAGGKLLSELLNPDRSADRLAAVPTPTSKLLHRFAVVADTGSGNINQYAVGRALARYHQKSPLDRDLRSSQYLLGRSLQNRSDRGTRCYAHFRKHKVKLWINGHDRNYQRSQPIDGVTYLVCGGGGATLYPVESQIWTAFAESVHSFGVVEVYADQLPISGLNSKSEIIDRGVVKLS